MTKKLIVILINVVCLLIPAAQLYAQSESTLNSHPWFKVKKINDKVWRIADGEIDNIYLIVGKDSALLFDTGLGVANLRDFIKSLTNLPLIVVNSHSHPDHSGSDYQFPKVYAHPNDFDMIRFFSSNQIRKGTLQNMVRVPIPDSLKFPVTDTLYSVVLVPIYDKHVFDLGDRKLEVIQVPGHTPGSICLLDHKDKILYTGDNDNTLVWLHTRDAQPLEIYLQSLKKINNRAKEFTTLLPGHGDPIDADFIKDQIICAEQIISGECVGKTYESFAGKGLVCGYKRAQIAYDPDKIKVKK